MSALRDVGRLRPGIRGTPAPTFAPGTRVMVALPGSARVQALDHGRYRVHWTHLPGTVERHDGRVTVRLDRGGTVVQGACGVHRIPPAPPWTAPDGAL